MEGRKERKYRAVIGVQNRVVNPMVRLQLRLGIGTRQRVLLETVGRVSGRPRVTPVGNGLIGDTFWIVTEHGHRSQYLRNIEADPRVRVLVGRRWRTGTAQILPEDDPLARQRSLPSLNARIVRLVGTEHVSIRIDLDPVH